MSPVHWGVPTWYQQRQHNRPPPSRIRYRPQFQAAPERGTGRKNDDLGAGGGGEQQPNSAPLPPPAWMRSTRDGTASRTRLQSSLCFGGGRRRGWGGSQAPSVSPGLSPKSPTLLRHPRNAASGQAAVTPPPPSPVGRRAGSWGGGGSLHGHPLPPPPRLQGCSGQGSSPQHRGFPANGSFLGEAPSHLSTPPPQVRHSPGPPTGAGGGGEQRQRPQNTRGKEKKTTTKKNQ